jgi:ABC-type Na+ efflux pump permease subunit
MRFATCAILYILAWLLLFTLIPSIAWLFGGNFRAIAQHPAYVLYVGILFINIILCAIFSECFNGDFHSKK